jgi:HSP20 family protein
MAIVVRGNRGPWGIRPSSFDEMLKNMDWWDEENDAVRGVAADVYETDDEVVVKMAVPGVKPGDISINVTGDVLTISGESREEKETKKRDYYQKQLRHGSFSQTITLPVSVESDKAEAQFNHGILEVVLPKAEDVKPKQIQIKVGEKE